MWLIYDYRQPDFCYEYLRTAEIPTAPDNYYLDCINNGVLAEETGPAEPAKQNNEQNIGVMGQLEPWDIACLYRDAQMEWPGSSNTIATDPDTAHPDSASLQIYTNADCELRAERTKPSPGLLARLARFS